MSTAYYRVGDTFFDTTAATLYRCKTAGDKTSSVWEAISGGGGGGGPTVQQFKIVSDGGDFWVCKSWDGTTLGTVNQYVAKPFKLRAGAAKITSEVIRGVTYTYTYTAVTVGAVTGYYKRTVAGSDGSAEVDYMTPDPIANDIIVADIITGFTVAGLPISILSATLVNSGTGGTYAAGNTLTVAGGTGTAATITVLTVSAGKIVTFSIATPGLYTVAPSLAANAVAGGGGSGATFDLALSPHLLDKNNDGRVWTSI